MTLQLTRDRWLSYHKQVLANQPWSDDCDSLASTIANLIAMEGHPLEKLWFAHVDTNQRDTVLLDHMIAFAECRAGTLHVVGDTFGPCYPAEVMQHKLVKFCRLDDITKWWNASEVRQVQMV